MTKVDFPTALDAAIQRTDDDLEQLAQKMDEEGVFTNVIAYSLRAYDRAVLRKWREAITGIPEPKIRFARRR